MSDGYQPVRIAPVSEWDKAHDSLTDTEDRKHQGKIVRVIPVGTIGFKFRDGCSGEYFLIHPDDANSLIPDLDGGKIYLCEHQILAD